MLFQVVRSLWCASPKLSEVMAQLGGGPLKRVNCSLSLEHDRILPFETSGTLEPHLHVTCQRGGQLIDAPKLARPLFPVVRSAVTGQRIGCLFPASRPEEEGPVMVGVCEQVEKVHLVDAIADQQVPLLCDVLRMGQGVVGPGSIR